jgi:hypothetical protein
LLPGSGFDPDILVLAADPVLQADDERLALVDDGAAAAKQQMRAVQ